MQQFKNLIMSILHQRKARNRTSSFNSKGSSLKSSSFPWSWFLRRFAGFLGFDLLPLGAGRLPFFKALDGTAAAYRKAQIQPSEIVLYLRRAVSR